MTPEEAINFLGVFGLSWLVAAVVTNCLDLVVRKIRTLNDERRRGA